MRFNNKTTNVTTRDMEKVCKSHKLFKKACFYGQLKIADNKAKAIAENLPDREEGGLMRGLKEGIKGGARSGLMGAGVGGLIGGPIGAGFGGAMGLGIGGATHGLKGLLFDETKRDYALRLAQKHPELVTALIKQNKKHV